MLQLLRSIKHRAWLAFGGTRPGLIAKRYARKRDELRALGCTVPDSAVVEATVFATHVAFGDDCYINDWCRIEHGSRIESRASLGPGVIVLSRSHDVGPSEHRAGALTHDPATIGEGCWIGAAAVILPGVTVAPGSIVAAGAVVTQSTAPDGLYAGVPARRIRDLP